MAFLSHARQRSARLALPAGGEDQNLATRQSHGSLEVHQIGEIAQIAAAFGGSDDPVERPARNAQPPLGRVRDFAQRLQPGDVGSESGDQHALAFVLGNFGQQSIAHHAFGARCLGIEDIGRIADQCQHAFIADCGEFGCGRRGADQRRRVEFPVTGMEDAAIRRFDHQRIALGDRVRQRHVADAERANLKEIEMIDHVEFDLARDPGFLELVSDQRGGKRGGVERHTKFLRKIRHRADVVFVRVGQHDPEQVRLALLDEVEIGEDQFGAGVFVGAEGHAQVDHQPLAVAAVEVDVHPDLARPAERAEQQFITGFVIGGFGHFDPKLVE